MKKIILPLVAMCLSVATYAQDWDKEWSKEVYKVGEKYPGYVEMLDGTKKEGFIKALAPMAAEGMQNTCVFYANKDDKKKTEAYNAKEIKGYKIADKYYKSMNYSGGLTSKAKRFLLLDEEGCIATYTWFGANGDWNFRPPQRVGESQEAYFKRIYSTEPILQKGDETPIRQSSLGMGWKKKMPPLVEDHPNMADKIKNKEKGYKMLNILDVIKEYNEWCEKK